MQTHDSGFMKIIFIILLAAAVYAGKRFNILPDISAQYMLDTLPASFDQALTVAKTYVSPAVDTLARFGQLVFDAVNEYVIQPNEQILVHLTSAEKSPVNTAEIQNIF